MPGSDEARSADPVLVGDDGGVRTIILNRPEQLNAIDLPMIEALEAAIASAQGDPAIKVIHLRGGGRAFCAGDDVNAQSAIGESGEAALRAQLATLQRISELLTLGDTLAISEVQGWAIGAGFSWVLNCDFRLWGESAKAFFPEVGFGTFVTGGATFLLPQLAGRQAAADMLFAGTRFSASSPQAVALAHSVHVDADLESSARALARQLAALPAPAAQLMKQSLASAIAEGFRAALGEEVEACVATTLDPATLANMRAAIVRKE
ncbi:enoyl-CoA hydratase/carnithine racemase [Sphingopyxis panaciterrae]|uniref:enoyl-CoA hydratase-related protein n=1 Tax=Sphingopyxis panaciterrae TaxID=363841 RepID=UPI00141F9891|nr:enoyl-CoA hydratase/carnithine racemase [Sphingopyxis panaciterrae]